MAFGVPLRQAQIDEWIRSSEPSWTQRLGHGWVGKKFLGKGMFGIAGLWSYEGPAESAPAIKHVVVKQVSYDIALNEAPWGEMTGLSEGRILQKLAKVQTKHIVKMYGGNKVGDKYYEMNFVVKMFLEFCPGGDLDQLLSPFDSFAGKPLPRKAMYDEADIWMIFWCLALGIVAIARGTEISSEVAWFGDPIRPLPLDEQTEICHFDMKPDNILFGYRDENHPRFPIAKIADFGEAAEVKDINQQDDAYGAEFTRRGNQEMQAPEQIVSLPGNVFKDYPLNHPRKGSCSSIFQLGCIMNCLLRGQKLHFDLRGTVLEKSDLTDELRGNWHHGIGMEEPEITSSYSKELRALVMECLLRESLLRPSAVDLVTRCRLGLKAAQAALLATGIAPSNIPGSLCTIPFAPLKSPQPPEEWVNDIDTFEYDLAEETFKDQYNIPSSSILTPTRLGRAMGSLLGTVQNKLTPPATPGQIMNYFVQIPFVSTPATPPRTRTPSLIGRGRVPSSPPRTPTPSLQGRGQRPPAP